MSVEERDRHRKQTDFWRERDFFLEGEQVGDREKEAWRGTRGREREKEGGRENSPWGAQLETRMAVGVNYFAIDQLSTCHPFAELSILAHCNVKSIFFQSLSETIDHVPWTNTKVMLSI